MMTVCPGRWGIKLLGFDRLFEYAIERLGSLRWETKAVIGCVGVSCMIISVVRAHDKRICEAARSEGFEEGYRAGYSDCNEKLELAVRDYNKLLDSMNRNKDV